MGLLNSFSIPHVTKEPVHTSQERSVKIIFQRIKDTASVLLHDTVEDTLTTLTEIQKNFGEEIAQLVGGLTKISQIPQSMSIL